MKGVVFSLAAALAVHAAPLTAQVRVRYDSVLVQHRAQMSRDSCSIAASLKTKDRYQVASQHGNWSASVQETDPVVVPYDQARACIQLQGRDGSQLGITIGDFRTLRVQWVNERLLYLFTDIGHVAGVGHLLDVEEMKWVYARTEYYSQ